MRKYPFNLETDEDVIIIDSVIDNYPIRLAVDTAATQTVIDWNMLMMIGYSPQNGGNWVELETSNGVIEAQTFLLKRFETLEDKLQNFNVLTYDFLAKGIISPYDGILGLDFFRGRHVLSIDFIREKLWLN
jgi:type IV secretory pathway VirB6-like protein